MLSLWFEDAFGHVAQNLVLLRRAGKNDPSDPAGVSMSRILDWRNLKAGVAAGVLALLIAGCGGGDGGSDSGPQTEPPPPADGDVSGSNRAPTIQGQPSASIMVGEQYTFTPSASDPDGDALTFSVTNLPSWASFDQTNGRISGTPSAADIGAYNNITVQVSDGSATASLPSFSITVADVVSGAATLSWTPPTQNTDGSALINLAGYEIRYGRSANDLSHSVSVDNASVSTYVLENLSSGVWYFAVAAVNSQGVSSTLSNVASKTI